MEVFFKFSVYNKFISISANSVTNLLLSAFMIVLFVTCLNHLVQNLWLETKLTVLSVNNSLHLKI